MNYGIVIFPSKKLQDIANSYRKRYDPHYALVPPHLTLKNVFSADDDQIKDIARKLNSDFKEIRSIQFKSIQSKFFQPVNNVIYFKVESKPELQGLAR